MAPLPDQLAALAMMSPDQLRIEWRRVYQTPPSSRLTPDLLRRGIAYRLQERLHGGLPTHIGRELDRLAKRKLADMAAVAAALAAASSAALAGAVGDGATGAGASGDATGARAVPRDSIAARRVDEPRLRPGTRLVRSWQGRTYSVLVTEHGFVMDDREYPSLSRIAEAVTGAHWSGPRFFGLTRRGSAKLEAAHG